VKKLVIVVAVVAFLLGALAYYLQATTPSTSAGVRFPLTPEQHDLLASVPGSASTFALIPAAAVFQTKLFANPVTRDAVERWSQDQQLPRAWMLGSADVAVWRDGKQTGYAVHLDPVRAAVLRMSMMFLSSVQGRTPAPILVNATASEPLGSQRLDQLLGVTNGLGPADAIVVQDERGSGSFPPIGRPALTAVQLGANDIVLTSVAAMTSTASAAAVEGATPQFPRNALVAATFRERPRVVGDLDRLFITKVSQLLDDGGSIVLYGLNPGTLLPRPNGLIVAKDTPDNRSAIDRIRSAVETFGEIKRAGDHLLISFDHTSLKSYAADTLADAQWPSNDWAVRLDATRAVPLLDRLSRNTGLRFAAPRIYRSSRDLRQWLEDLSGAGSIEAAHSLSPGAEELRVRITSK
jgi:hypothetical protein